MAAVQASFGEKGKIGCWPPRPVYEDLDMILNKLIFMHHMINWLSSFDDHHIILMAIGHWDQPMKTWYMLLYEGGQPKKMCCFYRQCPNRGTGDGGKGDVQPYRSFFVLIAVGHTEHLVHWWYISASVPCQMQRSKSYYTFMEEESRKLAYMMIFKLVSLYQDQFVKILCTFLVHLCFTASHLWDQGGE